MPDNKFPGTHQQSIAIAIALCSDENSTVIANMVEIDLFDPPYDDIVARCLEHRRTYKSPPGKGHIDDVFSHVFDDPSHKLYKQYDELVAQMVQQADKIDTKYVLDQTSDFIRIRKMRAGIAQAVEIYQKGGPNVFDELESVFRQNLKIKNQQRDYGFSLADNRALNFLDRDTNDYCNLGIRELDRFGVVPTKREYLAFLSPPNRGKSFFLTHCGKFGLLKGWKTAHYTLENSDDMTAQRYFQAIFSGVRHQGTYRYVTFNTESGVVGLRPETFKPNFVIDQTSETSSFLSSRMKDWRSRLNNLRIRRFPSGKLTFEQLEQDLDELKVVHGFEPEMLLLDMPQLMKLPRRSRSEEDWSAISQLCTDLRGLAVERNLALVAPQQGARASNSAKNVQAQHGSGAFNIFGIADNMITYSQTSSEEKRGLARLYTQKVRNDRARITILISQHYDSGQFCMDSTPMNSQLEEAVKNYTGATEDDEEEDAA